MYLFIHVYIHSVFVPNLYKQYDLQDTGYTKVNELILKEQVLLKLKDKEKYPIFIQEEEEEGSSIKKWNLDNLRTFLQNSKCQRQWSNLQNCRRRIWDQSTLTGTLLGGDQKTDLMHSFREKCLNVYCIQSKIE